MEKEDNKIEVIESYIDKKNNKGYKGIQIFCFITSI